MQIPFKDVAPVKGCRLPILNRPTLVGGGDVKLRASEPKVFGIYEHERNPSLYKVVKTVGTLLDTVTADVRGLSAAQLCLILIERRGEGVFLERQHSCCKLLEQSARAYREAGVNIQILEKQIGNDGKGTNMARLSCISTETAGGDSVRLLNKIYVDGLEVGVFESAEHWGHPRNIFLAEDHAESLIAPVNSPLGTRYYLGAYQTFASSAAMARAGQPGQSPGRSQTLTGATR